MPPPAPPGAVSWPRQLRGAIQPALPWAILAWLSGVTLMSVWHFGGWLAVRRMKRLGTRPVEPAIQEVFARLLQRLRIRQPVRLLESVRVAVPLVLGWLRPVILLPVGAVTGLTPEQLEAILAHELAHIRRWDCLVQALQAVMETLLFYHPAVWWVSRQIRQESEQCCDDLAVGICGDRRGYAHALAKVAEFGARGPALAAGATGGKLLPRIRRLLGAETAGALSFGRCLSGALALVTLAAIVVGVSCSSQRGPQVDLANTAPPSLSAGPGTVALKQVWTRTDLKHQFEAQGIFADGHVYIGQGGPSPEARIAKVEMATGKVVWSYPTGNSYQPSYPVSNGKVVIFGTYYKKFIVGLDDATGKERWKAPTGSQNMSAAAFSGELAFIGSYDKHLHAIEWATGKEKWKTPSALPYGPFLASPANSSSSDATTAASMDWTKLPATSS